MVNADALAKRSISNLPELLEGLKTSQRKIFDRIYEVRSCVGRLVLPEGIKEWAKNRFGECESQKIVRVTNKLTYESTLFNELRARRPIDAKVGDFSLEVEDCAFCDALNRTPSDIFGRVEGKHCITASNIAKYDCMHAVIIFKEHNPFVREKEVVEDIFEVAERWFEKAREYVESDTVYPFFMWNCLWRAGASIIHGHAQALVSCDPYSKVLQLKNVRDTYNKMYETEYLEDMCKSHEFLNLGFSFKSSKVLAYLTPAKEKEVVVVSEKLKSCGEVVAKILDCYYEMGVRSFNVAAYLPPLGEKDKIVVRVVDRGNLHSRTTDIGGMELYAGTAVVASDPFVLVEKLKKNLSNV